MHLRKITLIVIVGIICSFSIRTLGAVCPQIFKAFYMVKISILVNVLFILSHFLFWLIFYQEYASTKQTLLKRTCLLAVIGSFAVSFLYLEKIPLVFNMGVCFPVFLTNPYIHVILPFISSLFQLVFFVTFRKSMAVEEKSMLSGSVLSIIIGLSLFLLFHMIVLVSFIATREFEWLTHLPRIIAVGTVPFTIIAVLCILHFYYRFYFFLGAAYQTRTVNGRLSQKGGSTSQSLPHSTGTSEQVAEQSRVMRRLKRIFAFSFLGIMVGALIGALVGTLDRGSLLILMPSGPPFWGIIGAFIGGIAGMLYGAFSKLSARQVPF